MADLPKLSVRLHGGIDPRRCIDLAVVADANGFDSVWFAENPFNRGVLPAASACAAATRRLRIGIGVFNPYNRHPTLIAMEIGALEESLIVTASSGLVQTQSTTVTTNLNIEQLKALPFATRNLMDSIVTLPGIDATANNRTARINGLPQDSVVLTIDGIDARPSGGNGTQTAFYAYVFPQNDSIEQATATTAIQSAEDSGGGSAALRPRSNACRTVSSPACSRAAVLTCRRHSTAACQRTLLITSSVR